MNDHNNEYMSFDVTNDQNITNKKYDIINLKFDDFIEDSYNDNDLEDLLNDMNISPKSGDFSLVDSVLKDDKSIQIILKNFYVV